MMFHGKHFSWIIIARLLRPQTLLQPALIFVELNSALQRKSQNARNLQPTKKLHYIGSRLWSAIKVRTIPVYVRVGIYTPQRCLSRSPSSLKTGHAD